MSWIVYAKFQCVKFIVKCVCVKSITYIIQCSHPWGARVVKGKLGEGSLKKMPRLAWLWRGGGCARGHEKKGDGVTESGSHHINWVVGDRGAQLGGSKKIVRGSTETRMTF